MGERGRFSSARAFSFATFAAFSVYSVYFAVHWFFIVRGREPMQSITLYPTWPEIRQNVRLLLSADPNGYLRSLQGSLFFAGMAACFFAFGRAVLRRIFPPGGERSLDGLSGAERAALSYITGSLCASLIWFVLAMAGLLYAWTAWLVLSLGMAWAALALRACSRERGGLARAKAAALDFVRGLTLSEKALALLAFGFIFSLSANAVQPQGYRDVLLQHLNLPNLYIQEGRMVTTRYHHHSFYYQNTEMLVLWSLLFDSEFAAVLLQWGFLAAFALLAYGFLSRFVSRLTALAAVIVLLTPTVLIHSTVQIKNDLQLALFLFAHYCVLAEAFSDRIVGRPEMKRWVFLAGLICGGAVGHKLVALFPLAVSSALVAGYDVCRRRRAAPAAFSRFELTAAWAFGAALPVFPWALRTWLATGNPFYPQATQLFGGRLVAPWHVLWGRTVNKFGWTALGDYFQSIFSQHFEGDMRMPPSWGPSLILGLLAFPCLWLPTLGRVRWVLGACLVSWVFLLFSYLEDRYHIAFLAFLTCVPFAWMWEWSRPWRAAPLLRLSVPALVAANFLIFSSITNSWRMIVPSWAFLLSGTQQGDLLSWDRTANNSRWLWHLLNTRAAPGDAVLFVGAYYTHGLKRKAYYSFIEDKQVLADLADQSADAADLRERLRSRNVRHVILSDTFFSFFRDTDDARIRVSVPALAKIESLVRHSMELKYTTPDGALHWYVFADEPFDPAPLSAGDALAYSPFFVQEAERQLHLGNLDEAERMARIAVSLPVRLYAKSRAHKLLADVALQRGREDECERALLQAVVAYPGFAEPHIDLGDFYSARGPEFFDRAVEAYSKAIGLDPRSARAYVSLGNIHLQQRRFEPAMQHYLQAIAIHPGLFEVYNSIGNIFYFSQHYQPALQYYAKAIELNPAYRVGYENIKRIYNDLGMAREAGRIQDRIRQVEATLAE